jgi:hypothetical protein
MYIIRVSHDNIAVANGPSRSPCLVVPSRNISAPSCSYTTTPYYSYYAAPNNKKKRDGKNTHTHIYTARERQHKRRLCEKRKEKKTVHCIDDMCGRERGGNIRASQQRRLVEMAITTHASLIQ